MAAKESIGHDELRRLLQQALAGDAAPLEQALAAQSGLPGPRMNLALVNAFADVAGEVAAAVAATPPALPALLERWADLPLTAAPVNDPREIWPGAAVLAYGQLAVARPDAWGDEITKLHRAAANPRWRTRELVATALQRMLAADWERAYAALIGWLIDDDPLVVRAAAAAVAEPPLLTTRTRAGQALLLQTGAADWLAQCPADQRRAAPVRALRQALGFTLSVAAAAVPDPGFALLVRLAATPDPDLQWIVRENLKKARLHKWPDRVAAIQGTMDDGR